SHFESISVEQLRELEDMVNQQIRLNTPVAIEVTDIETAKGKGAMALFGEKYGDQVRVLTMGDGFSVELCGGTHVSRTGDIGLLKITNESGIAAGVRRIEAVTGSVALEYMREDDDQLRQIGQVVKGGRENLLDKVATLVERTRQLEKDVEQLQAKLTSAAGNDMATQAQEVAGMQVVVKRVDRQDGKALLGLVDQLKNKLGSAVVLLAGEQDGKVVLVAGVTKDLIGRVKAGDLIRNAAAVVGGKGGGRPDMAQGGGTDPAAIDKALSEAVDWLGQQ
uniref:DHHA1 domain-containing protein n=1 Tax=Halopseudomonas sp. TaxID=2901191 RepID=UPI003565CA80